MNIMTSNLNAFAIALLSCGPNLSIIIIFAMNFDVGEFLLPKHVFKRL
jgi:hypothetical protein